MSRRRRFTTTVAAALLAGGVLVAYAAGAFGSGGRASTAQQPSAAVLVGPGPVTVARLKVSGYRVALRWTPNNAFVAGKLSIAVTDRGAPVTGAHVRVTFTMLDMKMNGLTGLLPEIAPGTYGHFGPILDMPGHWGIRFNVSPPRGSRFTATFTDNIRG